MFDLFGIITTLFAVKEIVSEKIEPVISQDMYFDWDTYWRDVRTGMTSMEQIKKRQCGGYITTKPTSKKLISTNDIVDIERYQYDKETYGKTIAEMWKKNGSYRYIKNIE